ncbi:MAG: hypothetical protein J6K81_06110 [Rikenellaceae bacterium]|nr:hypothetical protein [Rikenellaceae bacterium]
MNKLIKNVKRFLLRIYWGIGVRLFPKVMANKMYRGAMGKNIDWENPIDLNEKINWMKFNYDTTEWTRLADKYLVREYVVEKGLADILVDLYGVWENANDIDFDKLPNQFVLKTNHGCGTIIVVEDKSKLDINATRKKLNKWLKVKFGLDTVEPHYLKIKPLIIAEELLINDNENSSSLVDYKVFCLNGKPHSILVCANRTVGKKDVGFYDIEWRLLPNMINLNHYVQSVQIKAPINLSKMIKSAAILSENHPFVRVDFYEVQGHLFFGEMTFTPMGGYMTSIEPKVIQQMGCLVDIN